MAEIVDAVMEIGITSDVAPPPQPKLAKLIPLVTLGSGLGMILSSRRG